MSSSVISERNELCFHQIAECGLQERRRVFDGGAKLVDRVDQLDSRLHFLPREWFGEQWLKRRPEACDRQLDRRGPNCLVD